MGHLTKTDDSKLFALWDEYVCGVLSEPLRKRFQSETYSGFRVWCAVSRRD